MKGKRILILGGARSGKSRFALRLGNEMVSVPTSNHSPKVIGRKVFLATAPPVDAEMKERIARHQQDRGPSWETVEAFFDLDREIVKTDGRYDIVLIDCLTLWLSNWIMNDSPEWFSSLPPVSVPPSNHSLKVTTISQGSDTIREKIAGLKETIQKSASTLLLVSNEVGMGVVPPTPIGRDFRDLQGTLNQEIAAVMDEVYFVAAGIPLRMK